MSDHTLSLYHLVQEPRAAVHGRPPLVLLLHGVGSHEGDLFGLVPYLDPRVFAVSARAPHVLAPGAYAWFHIEFTQTGPVHDAEMAERSRQVLLRFIDEAVGRYGPDPQAVYLLGFSQGAIMSLAVALTAPEKVAGVVAMSGRLLPEVIPRAAPPAVLRDLPIFMTHGVYDQILPVHHGRWARDRLQELAVDLTYREYPMAHEVTPQSLADAARWLTARLDGTAPGL